MLWPLAVLDFVVQHLTSIGNNKIVVFNNLEALDILKLADEMHICQLVDILMVKYVGSLVALLHVTLQ